MALGTQTGDHLQSCADAEHLGRRSRYHGTDASPDRVCDREDCVRTFGQKRDWGSCDALAGSAAWRTHSKPNVMGLVGEVYMDYQPDVAI